MITHHSEDFKSGGAEIDDGVEYEPEKFKLGPYVFEITTIAFMPIETLMLNQSKNVEISGQKLWCGSLGLAEYILGNEDWVKNCFVIELGAGTGVLGMLCKRLGAARVLLTDNDIRSINHMEIDCVTNSIDATVVPLDWFQQREVVSPFPEFLNVADSPLRIVAGDVLYKHSLIKPFMTTVKSIFNVPSYGKAEMVLCHVPRAGVEQEDVQRSAVEHGLEINPIPRELWSKGVLLDYCPKDDIDRAQVYKIFLAASP